ncbi:MAG: sulfotransferase [Planctomycetota bacterium]
MTPNFLVIGAQKSATSTLCTLLAEHSDVFMTDPKEPFFFSHDEFWNEGWQWYEALFEGASGARALGEGSTTYTQHHLYPDAPQRIAQHLPDARLIYIVRDPFERIESQYMHLRSKGGRETLPFAEAVRTRPAYIDNSLYDHQLSFYREAYPDDQLLVLFFEDFKADQQGILRQCFEFIGVNPDAPHETREQHTHASSEGRVDTGLLGPLRRVPLFERARDAAPSWIREPLRQVLKKPVGDRPVWDDALRGWTEDRLRDDTQAFLTRYGKPLDHWGGWTQRSAG